MVPDCSKRKTESIVHAKGKECQIIVLFGNYGKCSKIRTLFSFFSQIK